jgi:hypothetical protein
MKWKQRDYELERTEQCEGKMQYGVKIHTN